MQSLKLSLRSTRRASLGGILGRLPRLHPFPAAPPSVKTKGVLKKLKALQASWSASAWSVLQHIPIAAIASVDIRMEYQATDVALACVPEVPFSVYVGVVEPDIVAPVDDCWSLSVLGPILVSQFQHLCLLSITDVAFECLLNCGVDDLPALWALRIEFVSSWLGGVRLPTYREADEDNYPVSCSGLRVIMFENDGPATHMSTGTMESYLDLIEGGLTAVMFERAIIEDIVPGGESWMARAHRLLNVPE
ncbi:hypothetical protein AURDEDRAFT_114491 [Auricularia subglabra TFB-10046 SS5]|nr:hypothetical protein AURDEDRAFT_114491 [Auricularia subglabra TFB-10046 SS5]